VFARDHSGLIVSLMTIADAPIYADDDDDDDDLASLQTCQVQPKESLGTAKPCPKQQLLPTVHSSAYPQNEALS